MNWNRSPGEVELGVKASWQDGVLSAEAMAADPALAAWRDRLASRPAAELYYDRIELGRRVQTAIAARRDSVVREIAAALDPLAERSVDLRLLDESMILNQAYPGGRAPTNRPSTRRWTGWRCASASG